MCTVVNTVLRYNIVHMDSLNSIITTRHPEILPYSSNSRKKVKDEGLVHLHEHAFRDEANGSTKLIEKKIIVYF